MRWRQQLNAALGVKSFPVGSWFLAGSCLIGLALSERYIVGPMRRDQEAAGTAPSTSIFGDIAVLTGSTPKKRELPDGSILNEDGSIVRKAR